MNPFDRWAAWKLRPKGYWGRTVEDRIMEGRGELLPTGGTYSGMSVDLIAIRVDRFVDSLTKRERNLMYVYYLSPGTMAQKRSLLGASNRWIYSKLRKLEDEFQSFCG